MLQYKVTLPVAAIGIVPIVVCHDDVRHSGVGFCCAAGTMPPVYSSGPFVTLRFQTDKNCRNDEGFRINYSAFRYNTLNTPKSANTPNSADTVNTPNSANTVNTANIGNTPNSANTANKPNTTLSHSTTTTEQCSENEEFQCDGNRYNLQIKEYYYITCG